MDTLIDRASDRRHVLAAAAAAALLPLAGRAGPAQADSRVAALEAANGELVANFCRDWSTRDVANLLPYIADTLEYHMWEGGPVIDGAAQFEQQMAGFMSGMKEIEWVISRQAAIGDIVVNERIDHFIRPPGSGRPDDHFHVVGVFLVRDGKIRYWKDYGMPEEA